MVSAYLLMVDIVESVLYSEVEMRHSIGEYGQDNIFVHYRELSFIWMLKWYSL